MNDFFFLLLWPWLLLETCTTPANFAAQTSQDRPRSPSPRVSFENEKSGRAAYTHEKFPPRHTTRWKLSSIVTRARDARSLLTLLM